MTLTKAEFHCKMRYPARKKVTLSTWQLYAARDKIINLYQNQNMRLMQERAALKILQGLLNNNAVIVKTKDKPEDTMVSFL